MQNQKKAGQAEDWELSEEYYREDTGKRSFGWKTSWRRNRQRQTGRDWLAQTDLRSSWRAWQDR